MIFDNLGGPVLDAGLAHISRFARVVSCGRASRYDDGPNRTLSNWWMIGEHSARMQGFFVYDHQDLFAEAQERMAGWIRAGQLTWLEGALDGFERVPEARLRLFKGAQP